MSVMVAEKVAGAGSLAMLCETRASVTEAVAGKPSVLEPKMDGWRLIAMTGEDGKLRLFTRNGTEETGKLPAIEADLQRVLPPGSILDGEVVSFEEENGMAVCKWGSVQSVLGSGTAKAALASKHLTFVLFDLLGHGGIDARTLPLSKRRGFLEQLVAGAAFESRVELVQQYEATEENHDAMLAKGFEGSVVKWLDSPYRSAVRGKGWWRLKPQTTVDVVVVGFKEGTPGSSFDGYVGAIEFGQYDADGLLVPRGRCSGMDWKTRVEVSQYREKMLGRVFELAHMGVLSEETQKFRSPQFKRWRDDKKPFEAVFNDG